jgi:hypothetical protein
MPSDLDDIGPDEPIANSPEAQSQVNVAFDSVTVINDAINNPVSAEIGETLAFKVDEIDRNYRHIEVMMAKDWFVQTASTIQIDTLSTAALSGKTYFAINSSAL